MFSVAENGGGIFYATAKFFPYIVEWDLAAGKPVLETNSAANMSFAQQNWKTFENDVLQIKQKYTPLNKSSLSKASVKAI